MEPFRVSTLKETVRIYQTLDDIQPVTVPQFFTSVVEKHSSYPALASHDENGKWNFLSYSGYKSRVEKIAKVFVKLGLSERGVVAILAWNSPEWVIAALGAIHAGGVVTSIYTTSSTSACQYILESSQAEILLIDTFEQLQKINEIEVDLPHLKHIIQLSELNINVIECGILNWHELMRLNTSDVENEYESRLNNVRPNKCCAVMYTSGTTGFPKGVMMSHDSLLWNVKKSLRTLNLTNSNEIFMSYLPMAHLTAFYVDIFIAITTASTVYFTDVTTLKNSLIPTLQEIRPTVFIGVPRIYEKIEEKLSDKMRKLNFIKQKILSWSRSVITENYFTPNSTSLKCHVANYIVIRRIKEALGLQRCRLMFVGSAPLRRDTKIFFISLNMPITEAYGMTETSSVHSVTSREIQVQSLDTVGRCLDGAETKIINQLDDTGNGEICIRGRHVFMGYLNNMESTMAAVDDDGWLHTGDIGRIDENGLIYVTGRLKEMIITSGGENIPKARIENLVKDECAAVSNAFLVGDKRKFVTVLLTLKCRTDENGQFSDDLADETVKWLKEWNCNYSKLSHVSGSIDEELERAFQNVIDRVNEQALSNPQKIQKFAILPNEFSTATGELTTTLKLKRHFVLEKYEEVIENFYK